MFGYRKLAVVMFIGTIAACVELNQYQADVLIMLGTVYLGTNVAKALVNKVGGSGEKVLDKLRFRSVRDLGGSDESPKAPSDAGSE